MYECNRVALFLLDVGLARLVRASDTCDSVGAR